MFKGVWDVQAEMKSFHLNNNVLLWLVKLRTILWFKGKKTMFKPFPLAYCHQTLCILIHPTAENIDYIVFIVSQRCVHFKYIRPMVGRCVYLVTMPNKSSTQFDWLLWMAIEIKAHHGLPFFTFCEIATRTSFGQMELSVISNIEIEMDLRREFNGIAHLFRALRLKEVFSLVVEAFECVLWQK